MLIKKNIADSKEFLANDNTLLKEVLHPMTNDTDAPIGYSLAFARLQPKTQSAPHRLKSSETYIFIKGMGTMHTDKERCKVQAGDVVLVPPSTIQYLINDSLCDDLCFYCIVEPFWKKEDDELIPNFVY